MSNQLSCIFQEFGDVENCGRMFETKESVVKMQSKTMSVVTIHTVLTNMQSIFELDTSDKSVGVGLSFEGCQYLYIAGSLYKACSRFESDTCVMWQPHPFCEHSVALYFKYVMEYPIGALFPNWSKTGEWLCHPGGLEEQYWDELGVYAMPRVAWNRSLYSENWDEDYHAGIDYKFTW